MLFNKKIPLEKQLKLRLLNTGLVFIFGNGGHKI